MSWKILVMKGNSFNIPEDYFSTLGNKVVKKYHKKIRQRNIRIVSLCLVMVLVVGTVVKMNNNDVSKSFAKISANKKVLKGENSIVVHHNTNIIGKNDIATLIDNNAVPKKTKTIKKPIKDNSTLTQDEIDYLSNYYSVDNYELLTYTNY